MAKTDVSRSRQSVARLREELPALLDFLLDRGPLLKAYLDSKPRTCGAPTCRCAQGEKHPAWVARIPDGSTARSRSIPEEVFRRLEPLALQYREFRLKLSKVRRLFKEADDALRVIEASRLIDLDAELRRDREK